MAICSLFFEISNFWAFQVSTNLRFQQIEKELTSSNKLKLLKKWHPIDHMID